MTSIYKKLIAESYFANENNDCTVRAIAAACNISYKEAHKAMAEAGRVNGKGAMPAVTMAALESLGFTWERVYYWEPRYRMIIARYPKPHHKLHHITTYHPIRFAKVWADMPPCLLSMNGHIAGFKDGSLHDHTSNRYRRVTSIIFVTKKE